MRLPTESLVLSLRHLSGNRLAGESPAATPGTAGKGFEYFSDPGDPGEKAG